MAELAMAAWGVGLDEFYSTEANIDHVRGFTIPRLKSLMAAHTARRGRELREIAIAQHAPETIDSVYPQQHAAPAVNNAPPLVRTKWW